MEESTLGYAHAAVHHQSARRGSCRRGRIHYLLDTELPTSASTSVSKFPFFFFPPKCLSTTVRERGGARRSRSTPTRQHCGPWRCKFDRRTPGVKLQATAQTRRYIIETTRRARYLPTAESVIPRVNGPIRQKPYASLFYDCPRGKGAASILSAPKQDVHIHVSNPFNGCRNNERCPVGASWQDVEWWPASGCPLPSFLHFTPGLTSIH